VKLHDIGCSLKAYRGEVLKDISLYGEMHRFIPIYAAMRGARVAEIEVEHHPRTAGRSKYGLERTVKVLLDLVVVKFFLSFMNRPMHLFGSVGILLLLGSFLSSLTAIVLKLVPPGQVWGPLAHRDLFDTPCLLAGGLLAALAAVVFLQGILAEVLVRTYYGSQGKDPYAISYVRTKSARANDLSSPPQ
jgi:hypothetical protein